jgi:terminase small subunit-like protein
MPGGRPSDYTPELAERICELIATTPRGLDFLCAKHDDLPSPRTIDNWLNRHEEFLRLYLRARERQADLLADETLEIADDSDGDVVTRKRNDGSEYEEFNAERVARSKLRVDTRLRLAGKLHPKKWGDRVGVTHGADESLEALLKKVHETPKPAGEG